jgi:hypothetical protein
MLTLTAILDDLLSATVFTSPKHRSVRGPRRHRATYIAA